MFPKICFVLSCQMMVRKNVACSKRLDFQVLSFLSSPNVAAQTKTIPICKRPSKPSPIKWCSLKSSSRSYVKEQQRWDSVQVLAVLKTSQADVHSNLSLFQRGHVSTRASAKAVHKQTGIFGVTDCNVRASLSPPLFYIIKGSCGLSPRFTLLLFYFSLAMSQPSVMVWRLRRCKWVSLGRTCRHTSAV